MTREEKTSALQRLANDVEACRRCALFQSATRGVPGEGNPDAELLFVGEGPGQKEDELGRPFVGAAGRLLEELLRHIGLFRGDVYIANVVKHRPPGNRDPLPEELEACWPYLRRQIEIIGPKILVLLGKHALARFLPGRTISQVRGRAFRVGGTVYFPMYHPAAALYQGSLRDTLFRDMEKLPALAKQIKGGEEISGLGSSANALPPAEDPDVTQGTLL